MERSTFLRNTAKGGLAFTPHSISVMAENARVINTKRFSTITAEENNKLLALANDS